MKNTKAITSLLAILFFYVGTVNAAVKLPAIISSHMVLQRNTTVKIWGWADKNEKIEITTSWTNSTINTTADASGDWRIDLKTTDSKSGQTIIIKSKASNIVLSDVVFGEVWLCSGQSNMQQPVKGYTGQPSFGSNSTIAHANNPNLRLFTVVRVASKTPLKDLDKYTGWEAAKSDNVAQFSAVGYYFAQQLQEILDVPVGIIHTSWGASPVEAWMSKETLVPYKEVNITDDDVKNRPNRTPVVLFNAMIQPLIPYNIKGVLWYQGEANRSSSEEYKKLFPAMIKDWRNRWNIGDFPIYFAQIAPFAYGNFNAYTYETNAAFMREAQMQCVDLIPNSGIAVTMDLGDANSIHPPMKKEVADRMLYCALNQTYGYKEVACLAPSYDSLSIKNGAIQLSFKDAEQGLYAYDQLKDFEIAGTDKLFVPAEAKILNNKTISVSSDKVPNPVAVRYGWKNYIMGTLFGANLLPVSSFRTDSWKDAQSGVK